MKNLSGWPKSSHKKPGCRGTARNTGDQLYSIWDSPRKYSGVDARTRMIDWYRATQMGS